uniref:Leucine-rich repeat-containing N-terminal plant-type domain-containing protein n=1 Tax=Solanum lycopersicum TaxID=4081 RepID=A0A3Q7EEQ8_SOLLC
ASLGWRVVYAWVGDGNLPPWSGVTCSRQGKFMLLRLLAHFPTVVTNLLDLTRLDLHNNKITGPLPSQIGLLKRLKILYNPLLLYPY